MTTAVELQAKGLFTHPNKLRLPRGAQLVAENCVYTREGIVSRRRGLNRYGTILTTGPQALFKFAGRLIVKDGTTLRYDSDGAGAWLPWTGTFTQPDASVRMRFLETQDSFLFTTDEGVFINDALAGTPVRSGMPRALDTQLSTTGTGGGFFLPDNQVGYRITWRRKDANKRVTQGSPSFQERLTNSFTTDLVWTSVTTTVTVTHTAHGFSNGDTIIIKDADDANIPDGNFVISNVSANAYDFTVSVAPTTSPGTLTDGKAFNVSMTFTVPDDVVAGNEFEIFRTPLSASDSVVPGPEHRLIITDELTSAQKTAGTVTVTDDNLEDFFTANLYTNPSKQTESLTNDRPPLARFIVEFESHVHYFRTTYPHRLTLQLLDLTGIVDGTSSITIDDGTTSETYTFAAAENIGLKEFQHFTSFSTAVQNIEATVKSLQRVINRGSAVWTCQYISSVTEAPGIFFIETKTLGSVAFSVIANTTAIGDLFLPALPTSGTTVQSEDDARKNGYVRAKASQPEHAPELSGKRLGSGSSEILGVQKVTDAIWVYTAEGIYVISGESDGLAGDLFRQDDVDPTVILSAKESLISLNNAVAGFANQGYFIQAAGPPAIIDRPQVQDDLRRIAALSAFSGAFSVSYETENELLFWVPENSADTANEIAYVWNYSTNAWSIWRKAVQSGIVLDSDGKLYLGHNVDKFVLQERKSLKRDTREDYSDEDIPMTIDSTSTTTDPDGVTVTELTLTYTYSKTLAPGFIVEQGANRTYIEAVVDNGGNSFTCRLRRLVTGFAAGAAIVELPIDMLVQWVVSGENPNAEKQWSDCSIYPEDDGGTHRLGFHSDQQRSFEFVKDIRIPKGTGWGSVLWSSSAWGSSNPGRVSTISTPVPRDHQHGRVMDVRYENHYARESVDILMMALLTDQYSERSQREPR